MFCVIGLVGGKWAHFRVALAVVAFLSLSINLAGLEDVAYIFESPEADIFNLEDLPYCFQFDTYDDELVLDMDAGDRIRFQLESVELVSLIIKKVSLPSLHDDPTQVLYNEVGLMMFYMSHQYRNYHHTKKYQNQQQNQRH